MVQLVDLMILFVGFYVTTKMLVYLFRDDIKMSGIGIFITKLMAISTILITIVCIALAILSFIGTLNFDIERYLK